MIIMNAKKLFSKWSLGLLLFGFGLVSNANNLQITGTAVTGSNISFNVSWENSWNANLAPANWDAVWIFVKYQDCATRQWYHAAIATTGNTAASPLQVDLVPDAKGVFLRRSAFGGGDIASTAITLALNIPAGTYNYKVFGIEMVNIPQGDFQVGDATSTGTYSSATITASSQSGGLSAATLGGASVNIPATFPMGYNSFYSMKYEVTQEQYVEFLNTLTYDQQKERTGIDPIAAPGTGAFTTGSQYRNGVTLITSGNNSTLPAVFACDATAGVENNVDDGQNIAMNWMSWADLAAYLDWACLRPMTELEFEKICRGTAPRVAGEYPWGTTDFNYYSTGSIVGGTGFKSNENISTIVNGRNLWSNAVVVTGAGYGPCRVGMFATSVTGRSSSGAAYYGVMEMAGNVWERTVTTGNATGAAFTGALGDGTLTVLGDADVATWPSSTTALGLGLRGNGYYNTSANPSRTSDRTNATTASPTRSYTYGGRGVR
jgi:formylglycine-generating enzyme required for sulfatase activity